MDSAAERVHCASLSRARRQYECHDCGGVIKKGSQYYSRSFDKAIYCMPCYRHRRKAWDDARRRSIEERDALLSDLMNGPRRADELQQYYGTRYLAHIRRLKKDGFPIGRRKARGTVTWYLEKQSGKCRNCLRLFHYVALHGMSSSPEYCPSCSGLMQPIQYSEAKHERHNSSSNDAVDSAEVPDRDESGIEDEGCESQESSNQCIVCGAIAKYGSFCSRACLSLDSKSDGTGLKRQYHSSGNSSIRRGAISGVPENERKKSLRHLFPPYGIVHLAGKAKQNNVLTGYERAALYNIGKSMARGKTVSMKQEGFLEGILWKLVHSGLIDAHCHAEDCKWCLVMRELLTEHYPGRRDLKE